jgi:hypothetical protein
MRAVAVFAIGFTAAAICGCGSLPLTRSFLGSKTRKDSSSETADREPNPFRKTARGSTQTAAGDTPRPGSASGPTDAALSRDDDNRRLQAEIADLPADKQRAILREWKQIDASMRPQYLRVIHSQRLLRQPDSVADDRGRMTPDEYEAGRRDDDRGPFLRRRTRGPAGSALRSDERGRRDDGPFGKGPASDIAAGPRAERPGVDNPDVPDRFHARDGAGNPHPGGPRDGNVADRRRPDDSRLPSRSAPSRRPKDAQRGRVELTGATRLTSTAADPLSPEWHRTLDHLVELSDNEVAKDKSAGGRNELSYLRRQVYLRMLYLLSGKTTKAVQAIPGVDAADQEFWQKTMWGISAYFDDRGEPDRRSRATQTITRLNEAVEHLRAEADLVVRNVVFCRKIDSFGSYDKVEKTEFRPGEQVLVYAEIENFKTELTPEGHHRTRLKSEIELFQKVGSEYRESKQKFDFPPTEDICRSYRRDYFHSYILTLPQSLGLGDYVLKLTITDHVGNKIGSDTVQFTVK